LGGILGILIRLDLTDENQRGEVYYTFVKLRFIDYSTTPTILEESPQVFCFTSGCNSHNIIIWYIIAPESRGSVVRACNTTYMVSEYYVI